LPQYEQRGVFCNGETWIEDLNLTRCAKVTDVGVQAIAEEFMGLLSLDLVHCKKLTDVSLRVIETNCPKMKHLDVSYCLKMSVLSVAHLL
jgi:hypothetical protein